MVQTDIDQQSAPGTPSLFRNPDYLLWYGGTSLSALGSALSSIALPLLLLSKTGSAAAAGSAQALFFVAFIVASIPGGLIADRLPRRAMLIGSAAFDLVAVASVAVVAWNGHVYVVQVCLVAVVQGASSALYAATSTPALVRIVGKKRVEAAFAAGQVREALLMLAGPPLGVLLFSIAIALPFTVDSATFLAVVVAAFLLRTPLGPDPGDLEAESGTSVRQAMTAGLRFVWASPVLRAVYVLVAFGNMIFGGVELLTIVLIRARHGSNADVALGMVMVGVGMLIGSGIATPLLAVYSGRKVLWSSMLVMMLGALLAAVVPKPFEVGLAVGLMVFAAMPLTIFLLGFVAKQVPDELRGRTTAATNAIGMSLQWLGPLFVGVGTEVFGAPHTMIGFACIIAVMVVCSLSFRAFRGLNVEPSASAHTTNKPAANREPLA